MSAALHASGFARLSPPAARAVLALTAAVIIGLVAITLSPLASGYADHPHRGAGDVDLYLAEIGRIAEGESYYEAARQELHERGYPTRSIFNWRTPLPMWLLGKLPSEVAGRVIIGGLAVLLLALAVHVTVREGTLARGFLCGLLLIGGLMPCWLAQIYVMPVVWAGVLIGLSVCMYALARRGWGVAFGLSALFVRELAGPYCVVCLILAAYERRWRETLAWLLGLATFAAFYAWHAVQVMSLVGPHDRAHTDGWLQFGGAAFVISLAQMNAFLLLVPQWMTAVYLTLAMLGFAGWNMATGLRAGLTVCVFVILFAFVGQPFNQYWGSLIAPLLCLGAAQSPAAIADLIRTARTRSHFAMPLGANP